MCCSSYSLSWATSFVVAHEPPLSTGLVRKVWSNLAYPPYLETWYAMLNAEVAMGQLGLSKSRPEAIPSLRKEAGSFLTEC